MSRVTPCVNWATDVDLMETCDLTDIHPDTLSRAFSAASTVLYNATRRRWPGSCTDTFNPLDTHERYSDSCLRHTGIELPATDVRSIVFVKIDGVAIAASDYELRDHRRIVAKRRVDGTIRSWPCGYDETTAANTFQISYTHGGAPPADGVVMCAILAYEYALSWTPSCANRCSLPKRVTSVSRAGMTFTVIDPMTLLDKGQTGIVDVDLWVAQVNRGENTQRASVMRPGEGPRVSRTP